ncbi:MAG: hypothetical protein EBQ67_03160 [Sphingobacteriia bacterium]|nr:hypothetical protein [Sphingobacteriia bacterium]
MPNREKAKQLFQNNSLKRKPYVDRRKPCADDLSMAGLFVFGALLHLEPRDCPGMGFYGSSLYQRICGVYTPTASLGLYAAVQR